VLYSSQTSIRPLLAELVLRLQNMAPATVILTFPLSSAHHTSSNPSTTTSYQVPFGHLLTDSVDYSVRLRAAPNDVVIDGWLKYTAGLCTRFLKNNNSTSKSVDIANIFICNCRHKKEPRGSRECAAALLSLRLVELSWIGLVALILYVYHTYYYTIF
jgi:hypothetical protein